MYYAYVIYNQEHDVFYPGFASDVKKRLARHNSPNSKGWSKRYQPWELLFAEEFESKNDALKREKYFRSHAGREKIRRFIDKKFNHNFVICISP